MAKVKCMHPLLKVMRVLIVEGLLPIGDLKISQIVKLVLHAIVYSSITALNITNAIHAIKAGDGMALNRVVCVLISLLHLWAKAFTVFLNRKNFLSLLQYLASDVFNSHSENLNKHIQYVYKISRLLWRYYTITISAFLFFTTCLPFVTSITMMMPPPFEMGRYSLVYKVVHLCIAVYLSVSSICFDVLFMSLMVMCTAQLNILQEKLMTVFEEARKINSKVDKNIDFPMETKKREFTTAEEIITKECVVLHEQINGFVSTLSIILSFPLFVQYACGCFVICSSILLVTVMGETNTVNTISIIFYSVITFSQLAVYHWFGNEIIFKSATIPDACYLSSWYKLNRKSQRSLLFLMERSKRPLIIHLHKLIFISLESLGVIVRWSYSLFALIKARYN